MLQKPLGSTRNSQSKIKSRGKAWMTSCYLFQRAFNLSELKPLRKIIRRFEFRGSMSCSSTAAYISILWRVQSWRSKSFVTQMELIALKGLTVVHVAVPTNLGYTWQRWRKNSSLQELTAILCTTEGCEWRQENFTWRRGIHRRKLIRCHQRDRTNKQRKQPHFNGNHICKALALEKYVT